MSAETSVSPTLAAENKLLVSALTTKEIRELALSHLQLPRELGSNKERHLEHIWRHGSQELFDVLYAAARSKDIQKKDTNSSNKRKRNETKYIRRTARRIEEMEIAEGHDVEKFMQVATSEQTKAIYQRFYDATSNAAVATMICGVCAREIDLGQGDEDSTPRRLNALPNSHCLVPENPHPAHDLFDGKLLEPAGVVHDEEGIKVRVCCHCSDSLVKTGDRPPQYALANNLWIGRTPWQLQILTFPEQLLIALLYPRVYVFKLHPRCGGTQDPKTLQRGMRGTVSTYDLDCDGVVSMLAGDLMPRPPAVLASVISVTYIGLGQLPKDWLRSTFRVRRKVVWDALFWLKENNPKYYGDIKIDATRLAALPEDDVPMEITSLVRQTTDTGIVDQESEGYMPDHDVGIRTNVPSSEGEVPSESATDSNVPNTEPDVIPLNVTGTTDADLSKLSTNEMMAWGLQNLWREGKEGAYAVRHGRRPVSDFGKPRANDPDVDPDRPNFFEKAFPCLFPYGRGGLEADRPVDLKFGDHIKWTLQYHDRRFRRHETFPFVVFGISQWRQALMSARIQMRRKNFEKDARLMASITPEKLQQATREEEQKLPISDPAVRLLRQHVHSTVGRVKGSNQARTSMRSQLWSTSVYLRPWNLWITINPIDLHDPIAQIFAGENLDLDSFISAMGPDGAKRAQNIAADPYAAAKFFHFMIRTILETLFGVEVTPFQVRSTMGILGEVAAYFGFVEAQNRATLHMHMLVGLKHAPNPDEMIMLLKQESFRARISAYIKANLRAYLPGLESAESVKSIPVEKDIAYSRPPNPTAADYDEQLRHFELRLARTEQVHTCRPRRCLIVTKSGRLRCKRRAPFACSKEDFINEDGNWGQKRLYEYMNGWIPGILVNVRCNNDAKLLTNGEDTTKTAWYCAGYAAKNQHRNYNVSAILAKGYAYHLANLDRARAQEVDDLRDKQRLLLFRLVHAINREQELGAPMVISYLMGWGDVYRSHHYTPIYWSSFVGALLGSFPSLRRARSTRDGDGGDGTGNEQDKDDGSAAAIAAEAAEAQQAEDGDDLVTLGVDSVGQIFAKCQVTDYLARGDELSGYNLLDFFVDTYEVGITAKDNITSEDAGEDNDHDAEERRKPGRPKGSRFRYRKEHPGHKNTQRAVRSRGHNTLPNFIGYQFPRRDDPDTREFYCACMLLLLKPWRRLKSDLKSVSQSWSEAFASFESSAPSRIHDILAGIQYFHSCQSAAMASRSEEDDEIAGCHDAPAEDELGEDYSPRDEEVITEESIAALVAAQTPLREFQHGRMAVEIARMAKIFPNDSSTWVVADDRHGVSSATGDDFSKLIKWREDLERDVQQLNTVPQFAHTEQGNEQDSGNGDVLFLDHILASGDQTNPSVGMLEVEKPPSGEREDHLDPSELRADQRRAYDIIVWHLDNHLAGNKPPPLRMLIHGEGGTGKSKVIKTVTQAFSVRGVPHMLLKAAYTGVAASLIDGKTTHIIGGISLRGKTMSDETKARLAEFWKPIEYLVLDEVSMLGKEFLALLSRNISIAKGMDADVSFGGISLIDCGDFHQFPPVATGPSEALYYPIDTIRDSIDSKIGRMIYEEFTTVVLLKEQLRVTDTVWLDFLRHLRVGNVQEHHLAMLRTLVVQGRGIQGNIDFETAPWNEASLVTPRHAVRTQWNDEAARKMCKATGRQLYICRAHDTYKGRALNLQERHNLAAHLSKKSRRNQKHSMQAKDLPDEIEIAIGMQVMVTSNLETDLDLTNGARGEIVDIFLDPDEPAVGDEPVVRLEKMPAYILVKLERTRAAQLEGLEERVIPIEPTTTTYHMKVKLPGGQLTQKTVKRQQYPLTAAYAFTDYRSQGQTLPYVIVDIGTPPTGGLSLFNLYVALSRSSGCETIRLLRDFDDETFRKGHDPILLAEDDRLEELDEKTQAWWRKMNNGADRVDSESI